MYKKAFYAGDTAPFYAVFAIVISILFMFFLILINTYSSNTAQIPENLESYILTQRFLRSPECFTYQDISGRVHPLLIDITKFTEERLNKCYNSENKKLPAFQLILNDKTIQTANWDEEIGIQKRDKYDILVYSENKKQHVKLSVGIQNV